jgi:DNA-binding winged helix-turn-helix (wHTH) protein/Tfp pilus assembly protein PilF
LPDIYAFGPYQFDITRRTLLRDGALVALSPKALELLRVLVMRHGELVTKEELIEDVWHGQAISDANLAQHVFMLRKALHERSSDRHYVNTLPGEGYSFVGAVRAGSTSTIRAAFENPNAYQAYVKGRYFIEKRSEAAYLRALDCFARAAELEPSFAPAKVGIAQAHFLLAAYQYVPPSVAFNEARRAAEETLQIDPNLAEAETLLGAIALFYDWNFEAADAHLQRALERNPLDAEALDNRTWLSIARVRLAEALSHAQTAITRDPSALHLQATLGLVYQYFGKVEQAVQQFHTLLDMESEFNLARYYLGSALLECGRFDDGVRELEAVARVDRSAQVYSSLGYAYAVSGRRPDAEKVLARLTVMSAKRYVSSYSVAIPLVGLERYEEAIERLRGAYSERAPWMIFLGIEPRFNALREQPAFRAILGQIGIPAAVA